MSSHEPNSPSDPILPDSDPVAPRDQVQGPATRRPATVWIWAVTLAAGLVAGFGSWFLTDPIYGRYQPERKSTSAFATPAETAARDLAIRKAMTLETSITFGALGGLLGLTFGLAGGFAGGAFRGGLAAAAIGLMLGAAGGLGAARLFTPMHYNLIESADDLVSAILIQGAICAVVGAMAGAAFSLGLGEDGRLFDFRIVAGGLLGALAGLIVYQMAGGMAFPLDETTLPLSNTWASRLFARAVVAGCAAIGVMFAMSANSRVEEHDASK